MPMFKRMLSQFGDFLPDDAWEELYLDAAVAAEAEGNLDEAMKLFDVALSHERRARERA